MSLRFVVPEKKVTTHRTDVKGYVYTHKKQYTLYYILQITNTY